MNPIRKLSRLFKGNPRNNFISDLYIKTSKPLLVHPSMGKALIEAYLTMPQQGYNDDGITESMDVIVEGGIAVMDISGSLVDREMDVPCARSPVSYEAIRVEMEALLDNSDVTAIIARMDTPGGVASQNMDLSDFIYESRGKGKKLIAVVDDMAYSAGFGIASAFDEIWISRTGGVGSVGVVSYHEDHSEYLKKQGIKVEYIYAGDKKVFGNPAQPLSEEAREDFQQEVTRLYDIFTETVARNLGMSVEAVVETQASTFHGQKAIDIGFAHYLGTFDDVLASLSEPEEHQINNSQEINMKTEVIESKAEGSEDVKPTDELVTEPTVDDTGDSIDDVDTSKQDAEKARQSGIKALCKSAKIPEASQDYIDADMSVSEVSEHLINLTSNPTNQVSNTEQVNMAMNKEKQIDDGWEEAFK